MKKIKIAMVGLGFGQHMVENHIVSGSGSEYFELTALCDQNPQRLEAAAKKFGVRGFLDFEELLQEKNIPAIGLFTGPVGRADQIGKIIRAGKDVMTTKPFELDSKKAEAVLLEAAKSGRIVHLNSPSASYSKDLEIIEAWKSKYNLGRVIAGRHECWYKSVEKADGSWYDDPELCPTAPVFRLGIYGINDMMRIFGEPESVQVMQSRIFTGRPTPDIAQLTIRFKNGAIVSTLDGWCMQPTRNAESLSIYFENGIVFRNPLLTENPEGRVTLCVVPAANSNGLPAETATVSHEELSHSYQWEVFYKAIHGEKPANPTPPEVIINGIRVIEAMKRSQKSGKTEMVQNVH